MMYVSSPKKFLYWHIPKTGGTSLVSAMHRYIDVDDTYYQKELADINTFECVREESIRKGIPVGDHPFKKHFGFSERPDTIVKFDPAWEPQRRYHHINVEPGTQILMLIKNNRRSRLWNVDVKLFYEFTVVRNPLDRVISMFNYVYDPQWNNPHREKWKLDSSSNPFKKFTEILAFYYSNPGNLGDFFDSQVEWACRPYTDKIDVFKIEEANRWFPELCQRLQIENIELPRENVTVTRIISRDQLTNDEKSFCYKFLEQEYDLLGY